MIRVLLADDQALIRAGFGALINSAPDMAATEQISAVPELADTRVIVLTTFEDDEFVFAAMRAGASGFLGKGVEPDDLLSAIRLVAAGEALLSPRATKALITRFLAGPSDPTDPSHVPDVLTEREREILALVGLGLSNDTIAERLFLSPLTVKTHANRAMTKLGVRDRAQLVVIAYQTGLVRPGDPTA